MKPAPTFLAALFVIGWTQFASQASASCTWSVFPTPNHHKSSFFSAISALADNDIWAAGLAFGPNIVGRGLIEHWDGASWSVVGSPNLYDSDLRGIVAIGPSDVWSVGYSGDNPATQTLTEHWNGRAWAKIPSPNEANATNYLFATSGSSSSDVWAVGTFNGSDNLYHTLIEHWNGAAWSIVSTPSPTGNAQLEAVSALSRSDVWAVGFTGSSNPSQTLVEHWDGSAWTIVPSPNPRPDINFLYGVSARSKSDVWAVGEPSADGGPLVEHWDGSNWSVVPTPKPHGFNSALLAVQSVASNDAWSVGFRSEPYGDVHTLVEHWNGSTWTIVGSPDASKSFNILYGVSVIGRSIWAAGEFDDKAAQGRDALVVARHC